MNNNNNIIRSHGPVKLCVGCGRFMPINDKRQMLPHKQFLSNENCMDETLIEKYRVSAIMPSGSQYVVTVNFTELLKIIKDDIDEIISVNGYLWNKRS